MVKKRKLSYQFSKEELQELIYDYNSKVEKNISDCPTDVFIWDETLRDGEQTPGVSLNSEDKITIAKKMDEIGIKKFAGGFPAVSPIELNSVKQIQKLGLNNAKVLAIARPKKSDIEACLKCDVDEIVIFMPTSELMMKIWNETPQSELEKMQESFDCTKEHGLKFNWVSEDCTRSQPEHMINVFKLAIENGAESIIIGDTVGILQPESTKYLMNIVKSGLGWKKGDISIGIHTHNDFGLAVANTITAVCSGVTLPHVCINGYGERAGNAAFEEVVVNLERMNINTNIDQSKLMEISQITEDKFNLPLSVHKPIVGTNAFSHESGLHINAIIAHPMSYEPINPNLVGQSRILHLGKFSGKGAIINAMETRLKLSNLNIPKEILTKIVQDVKKHGEVLSKDDKDELFTKIKELNQVLREGITDTEFFKIVEKHAAKYLKGTWAYSKEKKKKN